MLQTFVIIRARSLLFVLFKDEHVFCVALHFTTGHGVCFQKR